MEAQMGLELTLCALQGPHHTNLNQAKILAHCFLSQQIQRHPLSEKESLQLFAQGQELCLLEAQAFLTSEQEESLAKLNVLCRVPQWCNLSAPAWRWALGLWVTTMEWAQDIQLAKVKDVQEIFEECPLIAAQVRKD